jgi:hypothetical protein
MIFIKQAITILPRQIIHDNLPTPPASNPIIAVPTAISEKNSHTDVRNDGLS